jgi:hypothetical protein
MFETLKSGCILSERSLRPGDLIFYKAQYKDKTKPSKRNGIVHVEIYLGQGRSIGSRSNGWSFEDTNRETQEGPALSGVKVYPSYKHISRRWLPKVEYHFRSIDPWIAGQSGLPSDVKLRMDTMGFTRLSNGKRANDS